ncbi:MAG: DivIVA domain-containing protein [Clostridia bacterium]|nr:DivIVA domain-containing protein [Clostridia bacterium]
MVTANDIRGIKFNRTMGGYRKEEVDDFLDICADTVEELTKQAEENTRKMQVLAETIVDYRNQEDSIRSALIGAQRMSESVIADAKKQAEDILAAAQEEAANMHEKALADTAAEQKELARVKQEVADFKARLMSIYREHLTMIGVLEGPDASQPATEEKEVTTAKEEEAPAVQQPVEEKAPSAYREVPDISAFALDDE